MNDHVLLAYTFVNGKSESLIGDAIAEQIKSTDNLAWVHMDANHRDTKEWLDKEAQYLDPFIIEALLADETRPRMVQVGDEKQGYLLTSILISARRRFAVINQKYYHVGDQIDGSSIIAIERNKVLLQGAGGVVTLTLLPTIIER